jgi:probable rRNA maturation factor
VPVALQIAGRRLQAAPGARVRRIAEGMLRALALEDAELSVVLCDDAVMRELNRRYRKRDRSTDVLAFAQREGRAMPPAHAVLLGDIVIALPTAARQARIARKPLIAEVALLLAHGLLHLLGCDHRTVNEDRRMRARTDLLLAAAALGGSAGAVDKLGAVPRAGRPRERRPKRGDRHKT